MTAISRFSAVALLALFSAGSNQLAYGQEPKPEDLHQVERDIVFSGDKQLQLEATITQALREQDELSNRLVALGETAAVQEVSLAKTAKRLTKLKVEIATLNLDLAKRQDVIAEVLAGLQNLEHNPPPALVVAPDDVLTAIRSAMVFGAIVPELRAAAEKLSQQLQALDALQAELNLETKQHNDAISALSASRADITKLLAEKRQLAVASNAALENEKQRAEELAAKAKSLKQLLTDLAEERAKTTAKDAATAQARAEAERKFEAEKPQLQMAFAAAKGQINYPAQGQIIRTFGQDTGLNTTSDGIVIATEKQAQVLSPVAGKIEFSGKFRSYGQMVILNPGDGYLVLMAGLETTQATHGQSVKAGEPVGMMGEKPSAIAVTNGLTNQTTPVLYVEFRHNGDPVDPTPWWNGNRQEAMR